MASRIYITNSKEHQSQLTRVVRSKLLRPNLKKLLRFCAEKTADCQYSELTQRSIAVHLWPEADKSEFDPQVDSKVRTNASSLRTALDEYYRADGMRDSIRLDMPVGDYRITLEYRSVFPQAPFAPTSVASEIPLQEFKRVVLLLCESESVANRQRNEDLAQWAGTSRFGNLNLREGREFEDFFKQLQDTSTRLSIDEMRDLMTALRLHSLMLDPLLSRPWISDCLELHLDSFVLPIEYANHHSGHGSRYAIPQNRFLETDAHFIFLEIEPKGVSDIHRHPGDELTLVLGGEVEFLLHSSGIRIRLHPGELVHFNAEQTHSLINPSEIDSSYLLTIRFFPMDGSTSITRPFTRQQILTELRSNLQSSECHISSTVRGWLLQSVTSRLPKEPNFEAHDTIQDPYGLARFLRTLPLPLPENQKEFLHRISSHLDEDWPTMEDFFSALEASTIEFPRTILTDLRGPYKDVYELLLLRYLFPAVSGVIVFRPKDSKDAVDLDAVAGIQAGASYRVPRRHLACSEVSIAQLTLDSQRGTVWNRHPGYEVIIPLEGEAEVWLRASPTSEVAKHIVSAGQRRLAQFKSDTQHRIWNYSKTPMRLLVVRFH